ncbi:OmpA family protein [Sporolactobacillus sp. CPB3-1]|uniref:OmpA family protein n=1 Tax=Sporolactobacillus mangiferae TaxID=2940498 RepID=A0ABT0MCS2_9BACL|nr:flagellar motor protein MotB [Sporolactobacillus mangiferae]MCL1632670.1 OmpA family protein [Sporolactobacillus mangiferae]
MKERKRRRYSKPEEPSHNQERWLITYSDLITLLLVFFIVMYSISSVENQKFDALMESLKTSFQGNSILQVIGNSNGDKGKMSSSVPVAEKSQPISQSEKQKDKKKLDALYIQLNAYIKENHLNPEVSLMETERGVQLTFREKILFDLGKADLKKGAKVVLGRIGSILNHVPNEISVEGHTDNTPFRNDDGGVHSNWELSGLRAQNVMNFLIENDRLSPERMHFVGYGEYRPVVKNDTPEHKSMNRRVNIVVIREEKQATESD